MHSWSPPPLELPSCGGRESQAGAPQTRLCGRRPRPAPGAQRGPPERRAGERASSAWVANPSSLYATLALPGTARVADHTKEAASITSIRGPYYAASSLEGQ